MNPHETAFVESFVVKPRRERALAMLSSPKNRFKFTSKFYHHGQDYFIGEWIRPILPRYQHPPDICEILKGLGAPDMCHFIGGSRDGEDVHLLEALKEVVGYGEGTVLSCIPGRLAYFEG
jgi:hypothetical protein